MAWTIPTYAGTRATGSPSNYRIAMFELCRAISERYLLIGLGALTFYKADGTTTAAPTMADLLNMPCSGANCLAYQNMNLITSYINSMAPYFTTTSGGDTLYSALSLAAAVGTSFVNPTKANDASWWQARQDALDLLTFTKGIVEYDSGPTNTSSQSSLVSSLSFTDAYANRYDVSAPQLADLYIDVHYAGVTYLWQSQETSQTTRVYNSRYIQMGAGGSPVPNAPTGGDCVKTVIAYGTGEELLDATLNFTIDGEALSFSASGLSSVEVDPFVVNSNNSIVFDWTTPASHPFTAPGGGDTDSRLASVEGGDATMWIDLTPYLTDQA
jgi:hypothetical protein